MTKRFLEWPGALFGIIFLWKVALLLFSCQPVPSNDAFFYDGPVVNFLLHGTYCNPSLALALPISGTEVFCAYPPLYQIVLLGWMSLFGVSALSAMWLHLVLFGICILLLFRMFRLLNLPAWTAHVGAAFLLVITFHDRPDSLAHVFGLASIYFWVQWRSSLQPKQFRAWMMVAFSILSLATGLQIGALYFGLIWIGMLVEAIFAKQRFPILLLAALTLIPLALVLLVAFGFPRLFAGFLEHARQTPSLTGLRLPRPAEILKLIRTLPGILAIVALLPWWFRARTQLQDRSQQMLWLLTLTCTLASLPVIVASMFILTPNSVFFASYLQPLVVGGYLAMSTRFIATDSFPIRFGSLRSQTILFIALAAIGSIRAIGMTTWGVACATDVSYSQAIHRVRDEITNCPTNSAVVLSSAFLYEGARHPEIRWIHSDWLSPAWRGGGTTDLDALVSLKPAKMILTQFDFYRRFEAVLRDAKQRPDLEFLIVNTAKIPAPDSFNSLQKVVQHLSWAPIIVTFSWKSSS